VKIIEHKKEIEKLERLSDGLYADWKSGEITIDEYRRMKVRFEDQIRRMQEIITNLEEEKQQRLQVDIDKTSTIEEFLRHKNITKLDRSILIEMTDMIYVYEYRKIVIQFRYMNHFLS
jgi:hypothetical protein